MIVLIMEFGTDVIMISIDGNDIRFGNSNQGIYTTTIEGLRLDYKGVCKEFPDLIENANWKDEAIKRFKAHIKLLKTEDEKAKYIVEDLQRYGYIFKYKQRAGFRPQKII